jgi:hypothetical protein
MYLDTEHRRTLRKAKPLPRCHECGGKCKLELHNTMLVNFIYARCISCNYEHWYWVKKGYWISPSVWAMHFRSALKELDETFPGYKEE